MADQLELEELLARANRQIQRVKLLQRGDRLYVRGRFPPKPGDGDQNGTVPTKRYEIATGYRAIARELDLAVGLAKEIDGQLLRERFDWTPYLKGRQKPAELVGEWIERLEAHHWAHTPREPAKLNTWKKNYRRYLDKLPPGEALSPELLKAAILERSQPGTRARELYCLAYRLLARFAGFEQEIDFTTLARGYQPEPIATDSLPTDAEIIAVWESLKNPAWRWVFGMLATYGLRNHEIFQLDTRRLSQSPGVLRVTGDTKTGERLVWPCPSPWWEQFKLWEVSYPRIQRDGKTNNDLGDKIGKQFKKYGIPFTPYRLRDAYAIRLAVYGVDVAIAARWMGHSVEVHCRHYLDAIQERHHQQVFDLMKETEARLRGHAEPE